MKKKKIIAFIDWYLPGYKAGGGQRAFSIMVSYLREYFDFYIVTRNTDFMETVPYSDIESDKWIERAEGESVWYCSEGTASFGLFKRLVKDIDADHAYVNGIYSWKFSIIPLLVLKCARFKGRVVVGTYGMLAQTAINIKKDKKQLFLKLSKIAGLYRNVSFHATSDGEVNDIKRVLGDRVDVRFAPHLPERKQLKTESIEKKRGELRLVSVARISPEKNTLFALECLSEMAGIEGNIVFDLYGPVYDEEYWKECEILIKQLPENIKVNYKGIVKVDDVFGVLSRYHFLFMPTRGENFGYAILESFMAGRPVIISDRTPWKDLENYGCGYDLSLDDKTIFKKTLEVCLDMEQEEYDQMVLNSNRKAGEFLNDKKMVEENVGLFE